MVGFLLWKIPAKECMKNKGCATATVMSTYKAYKFGFNTFPEKHK